MHSNLPHITSKGYYQFVTFRTKDSTDEYLKKLQNTKTENSKKHQQIDDYLDNSTNGSYLNANVLEKLKEYIVSQDKKLFELVSFVVMPNHLHILFKETMILNEAMRQLKGGSSFLINRLLVRKGQFWANDYYDKVIRDEKHFTVVNNYILNNAKKANLKDESSRIYTNYTKVVL